MYNFKLIKYDNLSQELTERPRERICKYYINQFNLSIIFSLFKCTVITLSIFWSSLDFNIVEFLEIVIFLNMIIGEVALAVIVVALLLTPTLILWLSTRKNSECLDI